MMMLRRRTTTMTIDVDDYDDDDDDDDDDDHDHDHDDHDDHDDDWYLMLDAWCRFYLRDMNHSHSLPQLFYEVPSDGEMTWQHITDVALPDGHFQIIFEYTMSRPFESSVALDQIQAHHCDGHRQPVDYMCKYMVCLIDMMYNCTVATYNIQAEYPNQCV